MQPGDASAQGNIAEMFALLQSIAIVHVRVRAMRLHYDAGSNTSRILGDLPDTKVSGILRDIADV